MQKSYRTDDIWREIFQPFVAKRAPATELMRVGEMVDGRQRILLRRRPTAANWTETVLVADAALHHLFRSRCNEYGRAQ